jgi:hypothetical protein
MKIKGKIRYIIVAFAFIVVAGALVAYYLYQKPVKNFANSTADITIEAKDLFDAFIKNEEKAITKFVSDDKTIKVKGKILEIIANSDGTSVISLEVGDPESAISCNMEKEYSNKTSKLKQGDIVTIQGQCTGYQELISKEVIMMRCGISD